MIEQWGIPVMGGRRPRRVYVYVPEEARENPEARFPVLYMFDGHNVFFDADATYGKSWGMGDYLDRTGTGLIVVGIDCNHRAPNGRLCEYSPFDFEDPEFGRVKGRGKRFMDWLVEVLKPEIDRRYPTLPERETTWIAGSSMGGLMSLYAVCVYGHVLAGRRRCRPRCGWCGKKCSPCSGRRSTPRTPWCTWITAPGKWAITPACCAATPIPPARWCGGACCYAAASCRAASTARPAGKGKFLFLWKRCFTNGRSKPWRRSILSNTARPWAGIWK